MLRIGEPYSVFEYTTFLSLVSVIRVSSISSSIATGVLSEPSERSSLYIFELPSPLAVKISVFPSALISRIVIKTQLALTLNSISSVLSFLVTKKPFPPLVTSTGSSEADIPELSLSLIFTLLPFS